MISYGKHYVDSKDIKAVTKVLKGDWLTQGPQIKKFETALKLKFGAKYCTVLSSGTAALHLTGIAMNWKKGDIILTTPISFLATANCILYSGATPDFVDIDYSNYNIDLNKLENKIKILNSRSKKVVAVIATDYAGNPCDWKSLRQIALKYNIKLVNDNCHAIGASYQKNFCYAVKYADVVTHSYHPVKNITTGEGGSILTNNKYIDEKIKKLRSHGTVKDSRQMLLNDGPWYYEMHQLGYNYRITDLQCVLGISQLKKLEQFVKTRRKIAEIYNKEFSNQKFFKIPKVNKDSKHAYHIYPLQINFEKTKISKTKLFQNLKKKGINLQVHYIPIHLQLFYKKKFGFKVGDFPVAEKFYRQEVSLPIYFSLKTKEIYKVSKNIKDFLL